MCSVVGFPWKLGSVSEPLSKNVIFKTLFLLRSIPSLKSECSLKMQGTETDRRLTHFPLNCSRDMCAGNWSLNWSRSRSRSLALSYPSPILSGSNKLRHSSWRLPRRRNEKIQIQIQNNRLFVGLAPCSVLFFTFQLPALILIVWRPALSLVFIYFRVPVSSAFVLIMTGVLWSLFASMIIAEKWSGSEAGACSSIFKLKKLRNSPCPTAPNSFGNLFCIWGIREIRYSNQRNSPDLWEAREYIQ